MIKKLSLVSFLLVLPALLVTPYLYQSSSSAHAALASHIVISEIQIGGANSTDEFVELYNPTSSNIDLTNFRLSKKTAGGTETDLVVDFPSKTISAHGYLLLAHTDYDGAPTEDITYSASSIASNNTVLLYDASDVLIDKVGLGTAGDSETATTANPAENGSRERKATSPSTSTTMGVGGTEETAGNGEDTDNNSNDFVNRIASQPQNVDSLTETPAGATPTPTGSVSPTATPSVTPTEELTPTDSPTPTETSTPSPTETSTPPPTESVTPTVTPSLSPTPAPNDHVVISEIQTAGGTTTDEFVELYNPTDTNIDVTGWRLAVRSTGSDGFIPEETELVGNFPSMTINAHGYLLIAHENYDGVVPEDITYVLNSITSNNTVVLYEPATTPSFEIVDLVGLGNAQDSETATTGNPAPNQSRERKASSSSTADTLGTGGTEETAGNGEDTDNNSVDFVVRLVSQPQDVDSPLESPTITPTPTPTDSVTPTPTSSVTPSPSLSPTPSDSPTPTLTDTPTPTETPTNTPTNTPTPTPTNTPTFTPSPTELPTVTPTTATPTITETPTPTLTETVTPTVTSTVTPSLTPTPTPTPFDGQVLGTFPFPGGNTVVCTLHFRRIGPRFSPFFIPFVRCQHAD